MPLRIMLFCSGNGAVPYRPESDMTQWWNRRDALVRCVAASLAFADQLWLYFPDDQTVLQMHMTTRLQENQRNAAAATATLDGINNNNNKMMIRRIDDFIPSERNVIGLWKRAATGRPGATVREGPISCRLDRYSPTMSTKDQADRSKRDILEHLQKTANLEFLREHRLNSTANVILRKMSQDQLLKIEEKLHCCCNTDDCSSQQNKKRARIENPLETILRSFVSKSSMVVTLHESADHELPCWGHMPMKAPRMVVQQPEQDVCLCLGAVRDMTELEHGLLRSVVASIHQNNSNNTIVQAVRLGPVAEFTSKILTVAGFHHYHRRLVWGLEQLTSKQHAIPPSVVAVGNRVHNHTSPTPQPVNLHFVLPLDISSKELTCDLSRRNHLLWCLVRCVVVALWRSKLGGSEDNSGGISCTNKHYISTCLTIGYTDDRFQSITQDQLVPAMAQAHQAAPSEYQILRALTNTPMLNRSPLSSMDYVIDFSMENKTDTDQTFYCDTTTGTTTNVGNNLLQPTKEASVAIVLPMTKPYHPFQVTNASSNPTINGHVMIQLPPSMVDRPATLIVLTQHLAYQNRLLALLSAATTT